MSRGMKTLVVVLAVLLLVAVIGISWFLGNYNKVVAMDENIQGKWAQVENQLKRRYDLIPNLVETVKGYAKHESELFDRIARYRTEYFNAKGPAAKIKASNQLETVLSRLLVLRETYPDLKANQSFLKLQDSLEGTENRIAVERKRYNEAVQTLNTYTRTFFGRFFATVAGVEKAQYYEIPEGEAQAPKVSF